MPNEKQLNILLQGVSAWNAWRQKHPKIKINLNGAPLNGIDIRKADLSDAELIMACLNGADLRNANLSRAILIGAHLNEANLRDADLSEADLSDAVLRKAILIKAHFRDANLRRASLSGADLRYANFSEATLKKADLSGANLSGANLTGVYLEGVDFRQAKLNNCRIYGISAWNLNLTEAEQSGLIITPHGEPTIAVENLEVAQFIYLLLNTESIRDVIDTIGRKAVLILGRFTPTRKAVLDALRDELRKYGYIPIMFDFQKPNSRSYRETVSILARLSRFVIADITSPKVILQELEVIVPHLTSVPIQPILQKQARHTVVIRSDYSSYPWFLKTVCYQNVSDLIANISEKIVAPAEDKAKELTRE